MSKLEKKLLDTLIQINREESINKIEEAIKGLEHTKELLLNGDIQHVNLKVSIEGASFETENSEGEKELIQTLTRHLFKEAEEDEDKDVSEEVDDYFSGSIQKLIRELMESDSND